MLSLEVSAFDSLAGPHYRYSGAIRTMRGGRRADFHVVLHDENDEVIGEAQLLGYPRWSEPLPALVARCIAKVLEGAPHLARPTIRHASLDIRLNNQLLHECSAQMRDGKPYADGWPMELPEMPPSPWEIMCWRLAYDEWGKSKIPPFPPAVKPPVYYFGGLTFCRLSDLSDEARSFCERWLWGHDRPTVPYIDDAVYEADMTRSLRGRRFAESAG
jgi:hypothetical protein